MMRQILQKEGCKFYAKLTKNKNIYLIVKDKYNDLIIETRFKDHFEKSDDIDNKDASLSIFEMTITEGRYHEIKRMFEAVRCEVVYLKRYSMGELTLDFNLKQSNTILKRDFHH